MSIYSYNEVEPRLNWYFWVFVAEDLESVGAVSAVVVRALRWRIGVKAGNEAIEGPEHSKEGREYWGERSQS